MIDFDTDHSIRSVDPRVMISTAGSEPGSMSKSLPAPSLSLQ